MKKFRTFTYLFAFFVVILTSGFYCTNYSVFSVTNDIVGTWYLEKFYIDNKDLTSTLKVTDYTEVYTDDGHVTISYKVNDDSTFVTTGNYTIQSSTEDGMGISFSNVELDGFDSETSVLLPDYGEIETFKKESDLHYSYYYNGSYYEFDMMWALNQ